MNYHFRSRFHKWPQTWYFIFWALLVSLKMMISSSTHFLKSHNFVFLYGWVTFHGISMYHETLANSTYWLLKLQLIL
jgi:hypothetical protein